MCILYLHATWSIFFQASENVLSLVVPDTFIIPKAQYFTSKTQRCLFGFGLFRQY